MFKVTALLVPFLALICFFTCCSPSTENSLQQWMMPNGKVKTLSTTAMINDLVKQIGGEYIDTTVLIKGELDPHSYQLVKGDDEKFAFADLIFSNGLGLEHGPSLQSILSKNPKVFSLGQSIIAENPSLLLYYRGQPDPHIWLDINIWKKGVPLIVEALSKKDPAHASYYKENGDKLIADLERTDREVRHTLHQVPSEKRYLVSTHDAFNYFTRSYLAEPGEPEAVWRERFVAPEGLAPESQISASDIQAIITHLNKYKIRALFPESNINRDSIKKIVDAAREKGMDVHIADGYLYADAMGKPGSDGDTYIKMMLHNGKTIAECLKKNGG